MKTWSSWPRSVLVLAAPGLDGVLLLNTVLTVRRGMPGSHAHRGWEGLSGAIAAAVAAKPEPIVFLLWGAQAQTRRASHGGQPFVGSAPFRRANEELVARGRPTIEWDLSAP